MHKKLFITAVSFGLLFSCQNAETTADEEVVDLKEDKEELTTEPENDAPESYEKGGLKIYPKDPVARFANASLKLNSPTDKAVINGETVSFDFEVNNYELGKQTEKARMNLANSANGQHIHLIIDNNPYSAHYEPRFEKKMERGHHYAIAFLSRSYHESVKNPNAAEVFQFYVGQDEDDPKMMDLTQPLLFYSRPKGTYSGDDAKKVLFDFYLKNAELSADGFSVKTTINDSLEFEFDTWQPYIIEGLPMGENTIKIELIDATGTAVNSEVNSITRKFTLES